MELVEIEYGHAKKLLETQSSCDNYFDSLASQAIDYLSRYRFFKNLQNEIFGISPENNVHIYSKDDVSIEDFFRVLSSQNISPALIFSYFSNDKSIRNHLPGRNLNSKPFYYLNKTPLQSVPKDGVEIRLASSLDQETVNEWYRCFNDEESSNWETPQLSDGSDIKLSLLYANSRFVGAAANTLVAPNRFWIGRLWIHKEFRRNGFGENLMSALENVAFSEGKTLSLLVSNQNEKALSLYRKLNYKKVSLNSFWY